MCKHCWDDSEATHHKDFVQGAVESEDFYDEVDYRQRKKKKPRPRRGCPGNDSKAHVYVWTSEFEPTGKFRSPWSDRIMESFFSEYGFHQYERKVCVGCGQKVASRYTQEFLAYANKMKRKHGHRWSRYIGWY